MKINFVISAILNEYNRWQRLIEYRQKETDKAGIKYETVFSWITLTVHSSLEAYGFTAVFSTALAEQEIACNVVAGYYHDHLFVPKGDVERAMTVLNDYRTH